MQVIIDPYKVEINTFEDGVFQIQAMQGSVIKVLASIKERQKELVRLRFKQGAVVQRIVEADDREGTMDRLSQATGISRRTLYECRQFYNLPELSQSMDTLELWMDEKEANDKAINWTYCRNLCRKTLPESKERRISDVVGKAEKLERDAAALEMEADAIIVEEYTNGQVNGMATRARQIGEETRFQMSMADAKPERIQDNPYLRFVRKQPCCVTGTEKDVQAHHFLTGGMSTKGSDFATVPLCAAAHRELHDTGKETFQKKYGVNFYEIGFNLLHEYFIGVKP